MWGRLSSACPLQPAVSQFAIIAFFVLLLMLFLLVFAVLFIDGFIAVVDAFAQSLRFLAVIYAERYEDFLGPGLVVLVGTVLTMPPTRGVDPGLGRDYKSKWLCAPCALTRCSLPCLGAKSTRQ